MSPGSMSLIPQIPALNTLRLGSESVEETDETGGPDEASGLDDFVYGHTTDFRNEYGALGDDDFQPGTLVAAALV